MDAASPPKYEEIVELANKWQTDNVTWYNVYNMLYSTSFVRQLIIHDTYNADNNFSDGF